MHTTSKFTLHKYRACSQENESRSERRFGKWFGPFLIWKPDFTLCECNAPSNQAFETRFWNAKKKGVLDCDPRRKPDSRTCERKALSDRDSCVYILDMHAEAMHGSISANCAVGTKYYLAVRRSWSWLGRHLQCMWIVQITIPITKWIAIRNIFQNMIHSFVNTAIDTRDATSVCYPEANRETSILIQFSTLMPQMENNLRLNNLNWNNFFLQIQHCDQEASTLSHFKFINA